MGLGGGGYHIYIYIYTSFAHEKGRLLGGEKYMYTYIYIYIYDLKIQDNLIQEIVELKSHSL